MLTSEHMTFEMTTQNLQETISELIANLTVAETLILGLQNRLQSVRSTYNDLRVDVASLEVAIQLELRQLLEEAISLRQELRTQVNS